MSCRPIASGCAVQSRAQSLPELQTYWNSESSRPHASRRPRVECGVCGGRSARSSIRRAPTTRRSLRRWRPGRGRRGRRGVPPAAHDRRSAIPRARHDARRRGGLPLDSQSDVRGLRERSGRRGGGFGLASRAARTRTAYRVPGSRADPGRGASAAGTIWCPVRVLRPDGAPLVGSPEPVPAC